LKIKLAGETALSIEDKNQFCVGIILKMRISTCENYTRDFLSCVENSIFSLKITLYMLVAICRPPLYRPQIKVYRPPL